MKYEYANGSVDRQQNPAVIRPEVDRDMEKLSELLKNHPEIMRKLSKDLVPQNGAVGTPPPEENNDSVSTPDKTPASGGDTMHRLEASLGYDKVRHQHPQQTTLTESFVAGQACDIVDTKLL